MLEVVRRLVFLSSLVLASSALGQRSFDWTIIESFELAPGERKILLVQQRGFDLAVRVLTGSGSDEPYSNRRRADSQSQLLHSQSDQSSWPFVHSVQEGPDYTIGAEVVTLENLSATPISYAIQIAPVLSVSIAPNHYQITEPELENAVDWEIARAIHQSAQIWLRPDSLADEVIGILEPFRERSTGSPMEQHLWLHYAEALVRSGQAERAIAALAPYLQERAIDDATSAYLYWQYVIALNQGLYQQEALAQIERLATAMENLPVAVFANASEYRWLLAQVRNSLAAVRVGVARAAGDDALMESAGELMKRNLVSVRDHPDPSLRARLTQYLAGYYSFTEGRGNAVSQQLLLDAEEIFLDVGDEEPLAVLRNNQAYAALGRGEINDALRLYLEALDLRTLSKHEEGHAFVRARLGYLYFTLGDYRRARVRYQESIAMYQNLGLERQLVHSQLELAEVLRAAGDNTQALELLFSIRDTIDRGASIESRLRLASQIAHNLIDLGDTVAADEVIRTIIEDFDLSSASGRERLEFASRLFYVLEFDILQARLSLANDQSDAALTVTNNALSLLADRQSEPLQNLELLYLQMQAHASLSDTASVLTIGREAMALVNTVAGAVDYQFQGARWVSRTAHIQQLMVSTYLSHFMLSQEAAAFDAAIALLQQFRALNLRQSRSVTSTEHDDEILDGLNEQLTVARQELVSAVLADAPSVDLENTLARLEEAVERRRIDLFAGNPELRFLNREEIQARLAPEENVLIYSTGERASHLLLLRRDDYAVYALDPVAELGQQLELALDELAVAGSELQHTQQLANSLLPLNEFNEESRLLIEAEGILTRIPFNVLAYLRARDSAPVTNISMVPSLSEYFSVASENDDTQDSRLQVAILADPVITVAESEEGESSQPSQSRQEPEFSRLPYTQLEAEAIIATFGEQTSRAYLGEDASIANLYTPESRTARILHIASHGFASEEDSLLLGLALANGAGNTVSSGLVTADQISAYSFGNELVVISACETGVGQALNGEPLMSLGRVFLASGAKAALTTLWPISDRANAEFMASFYRALWELRLPAPEALSFAQQELMRIPRYSHPFYWGAFQYQVVEHNSRPVTY
jgi:CHAT domain-containing protein